mmetsp:Transcript_712/g.2112  ORF Transcript_712/g.2112 Transcript_712/m.2112 type:complete len:478 (-) Transcript_712:356-1789(-)
MPTRWYGQRWHSVATWLAAVWCLLRFATAGAAVGGSQHTSNWAVIVSTSRYWFNYRHATDALTFYHTVRRLGIPDSNIILMLPDDYACNPRNSHPAQMFNNKDHAVNLYGEEVEVDYRGYEVTVDSFLDVLTGRHQLAVPISKRLKSDSDSNVLVYLTGHGGDDFLKFQDQEEMMGGDLSNAIAQMWEARRYRRLLLFVETCEAETLTTGITSPNVITIATSKLGEKSYSHHTDLDVGLAVTDRVTYFALQWFKNVEVGSNDTLQDFLDYVGSKPLQSTLVWDASRYPQPPSEVRVMDFFGSVLHVLPTALPLLARLPPVQQPQSSQPNHSKQQLHVVMQQQQPEPPDIRPLVASGDGTGGSGDTSAVCTAAGGTCPNPASPDASYDSDNGTASSSGNAEPCRPEDPDAVGGSQATTAACTKDPAGSRITCRGVTSCTGEASGWPSPGATPPPDQLLLVAAAAVVGALAAVSSLGCW